MGAEQWLCALYFRKMKKCPQLPEQGELWTLIFGDYRVRSSQKATALAAATFRESTPWDMGIFTV